MQYRRVFVAGGTYFFTVNLLERDKSLLTDHIDLLKTAFRKVKLSKVGWAEAQSPTFITIKFFCIISTKTS